LRVRVPGAALFAGAAALTFVGLASMASAQPPPAPAAARGDSAPGHPAPPAGHGDNGDNAHAEATFQTLCSKCHDLGMVTSAKHDRAGWEEVLQRMSGHGLVASDEEVKEVLDYLATNPTPSQ